MGSSKVNSGIAARMIGALSVQDAESLQSQLNQQLDVANRGMANWTRHFSGYLATAETALTGFQRSTDSTFNSFAQGMTKGAENSARYASSVSDAMTKSLRSILSSISSESIVRALYNSGLGFYYMAIQAYSQAAQAFEAAAIFGSIAGVASGLGGAVSAGSSGSPSSGASRSTARTTVSASISAASTAPVTPSGGITVMVMGEPQAAAWLTRVINTGVEKYDLRLTASHTKRSAPAGR